MIDQEIVSIPEWDQRASMLFSKSILLSGSKRTS